MSAETIYLMGKINTAEGPIADFAEELESRGHIVLEKWWEYDKLPVPYLDHMETSAPASEVMIDAAYSSGVGILFPSDTILGAAVEFGAAIASKKVNPEKKIIVVDPFEVRQSVFYAHPAVVAVSSICRIRKMDWF